MSAGSPLSLRTARSSGMTPRSRTQVPSRSVGSGASHSCPTCAPASERPSATCSWVRRSLTASDVVVGDVDAEARLEVLGERHLADHVERAAAALTRELVHPPALQLGEPRPTRRPRTSPSAAASATCSRSAAARARQSGSRYAAMRASRSWSMSSPNTVPTFRLNGLGHRELHRERPRRDLRPDLRAPGHAPPRAARAAGGAGRRRARTAGR